MNQIITPSQAVQLLLEAAVPERTPEFRRLWKTYSPSVEIAGDTRGFTFNANKRRILFQHKALDVLWIIGFSAWESIATYSPAIAIALGTSKRLEDALGDDEERGQIEMHYKTRLVAAREIIESNDTDPSVWPQDVPQPGLNRSSASIETASAYDLTLLATAFVLFHEFRHVMLDRDSQRPADPAEEELLCDTWARDFMTNKLAAYAQAHGHSYSQVLNKRAAAMALGSLMLHEITPIATHGGVPFEYPPLAARIRAITGTVTLPEDATYWIYAACLLVGALRRQHRTLDIVTNSPRRLVESLIAMFD
ncbi:phage exclusion protein Lit family protein [Paraburkholderia aspalathi]|uniref:Peptidase U49 n=1 Tax=Paraburkholderia aspalathi TaxID=1324617 RepID=A0A1I6Y572_9BURK|nr:phage exclusion protein Lit family protein [Paraburkholderia aspalathi]SFT45401.1 Peptidase U49 [Paraburkholderia aspalathi]